mgnify:CR=1 FL=1
MKTTRRMKTLLLLLILGLPLFCAKAPNARAISVVDTLAADNSTPAPNPTIKESTDTSKGTVYSIGGTSYSYRGDPIHLVYESKDINLKKTPAVTINGTVMVPLKQSFANQGIEVKYKYRKKLKKITIYKNGKFVNLYLNQSTMEANQKKITLPVSPMQVTYKKSKVKTILVPLKSIADALGINYLWDSSIKTAQLSKPVLNFIGRKSYTRYSWSFANYAALQYRRNPRVALKEYKRLINPKKDTTYGFQYLRLNEYREVDENKFISTFNYYVNNACRNQRRGSSYSVLYGKGKVMLAAAKKYNIDPMYFVSQTFLESGYGTSHLARGNRIKKVALPSFARSGGKFITKSIKKSTTVYNLYGIKAYDSDPYTGATSYAYYQGWTTVDKAIYGAAKFISSNYFQASPSQNTIFKFRFNPSNVSHQYATSPAYAENIAQRMMLFSSCYSPKAKFVYDYPKYQ